MRVSGTNLVCCVLLLMAVVECSHVELSFTKTVEESELLFEYFHGQS